MMNNCFAFKDVRCRILTVSECDKKCRFYKTPERFAADQKAAEKYIEKKYGISYEQFCDIRKIRR